MTTLQRPKLADAYIDGARNVAVETTPGRKLQFFGGHAVVTDERDLPRLFSMPNIKLDIDADGEYLVRPWYDGRSELNPIRAVVSFPTVPESVEIETPPASPPVDTEPVEKSVLLGGIEWNQFEPPSTAAESIALEDLFKAAEQPLPATTHRKPGRPRKQDE